MNFNRVAPVYDRLAHLVFGQTLERAQLALLDRLPDGGQWLLVGGGTGWLLEQVLNRCQPISILYLEASERMLDLTQQRLANHAQRDKVAYRLGTEADLTDTDRFDIIVTPFVLDLFSEYWLKNQMIPCLLETLEAGGYWLVTDFVPPISLWQRVLANSMLLFFRVTAGLSTQRLPDWIPLLQTWLELVAQQAALQGMIQSGLFTQSSETARQYARTDPHYATPRYPD